MINLVGVYNVDGQSDVHLLEFKINSNHENIDIGEFTQKVEGTDRLNWQTPWDEKYLNEAGTEVTGDWLNEPVDSNEKTRLAFFFHFLDFDKPLETPFGKIVLQQPTVIPERLEGLVEYEEPD